MKRFKNYALWAAIVGFIPTLLNGLGVYDIHVLLPDNYDKIVYGLLSILVLAGIINNPTKGKGFKDE